MKFEPTLGVESDLMRFAMRFTIHVATIQQTIKAVLPNASFFRDTLSHETAAANMMPSRPRY